MTKPRFLTPWEGLGLALLALGLVAWLLWPRSAGGTVEVSQGGRTVGTFSLTDTREVRLEGDYPLTVVIREGTVRVTDAACPDRICQRHSPISRAGESIVCIPAQVIVTVKGGSANGPDAVSG